MIPLSMLTKIRIFLFATTTTVAPQEAVVKVETQEKDIKPYQRCVLCLKKISISSCSRGEEHKRLKCTQHLVRVRLSWETGAFIHMVLLVYRIGALLQFTTSLLAGELFCLKEIHGISPSEVLGLCLSTCVSCGSLHIDKVHLNTLHSKRLCLT